MFITLYRLCLFLKMYFTFRKCIPKQQNRALFVLESLRSLRGERESHLSDSKPHKTVVVFYTDLNYSAFWILCACSGSSVDITNVVLSVCHLKPSSSTSQSLYLALFFSGRLFQSAALLLTPGARLPFYFVVVVKLLAWEDWTTFAAEEINFLSLVYDQHVRGFRRIIAVWSSKWLLIWDYKGDGGGRKKITRPLSWTWHCGYGEAIASWCQRAIFPPDSSSAVMSGNDGPWQIFWDGRDGGNRDGLLFRSFG